MKAVYVYIYIYRYVCSKACVMIIVQDVSFAGCIIWQTDEGGIYLERETDRCVCVVKLVLCLLCRMWWTATRGSPSCRTPPSSIPDIFTLWVAAGSMARFLAFFGRGKGHTKNKSLKWTVLPCLEDGHRIHFHYLLAESQSGMFQHSASTCGDCCGCGALYVPMSRDMTEQIDWP